METIRDRLLRSTGALQAAGVPYAVIGGNAVLAWVEQVDESAVRFTRDVDIVLRREDLARATAALAAVGFGYRHSAGMDMFLDGPEAKARDAVHVTSRAKRCGWRIPWPRLMPPKPCRSTPTRCWRWSRSCE